MIVRYHSTDEIVSSGTQIIPTIDGGSITWGGNINSNNYLDYVCLFRSDVTDKIKWSTKLIVANKFLNQIRITESLSHNFLITGLTIMPDLSASFFFIGLLDDNGSLLWFHFYKMLITNGKAAGDPVVLAYPTIDQAGNIYTVTSYNYSQEVFTNRNFISVASKFSQHMSFSNTQFP